MSAGIYRIITSNGYGYIGQTTGYNQPAVYRVADHVIDAYSLPNYHYDGRVLTRDTSGKLTDYIRANGGQSLRYYLNEDETTAFGFGAENWSWYHKFWASNTKANNNLHSKLDIMELAGTYIAATRGAYYNTQKGGTSNVHYKPTILADVLQKHFENNHVDPIVTKTLIDAIKKCKYSPSTQNVLGLAGIFDPEYNVLNKVWGGKKINDLMFPAEKVIKILKKCQVKKTLRASTSPSIAEVFDEKKVYAEVFKYVKQIAKVFDTIPLINTREYNEWLRLDYIKVTYTLVDKERFWDDFWKNGIKKLVTIQNGKLVIEKQIHISKMGCILQIVRTPPTEPSWVSTITLPQTDVKEQVKEAFILNFAQIVDAAREERVEGKSLKRYVAKRVTKGIIFDEFSLFYTKMMKAINEPKFGNLLFSLRLDRAGLQGERDDVPAYKMRRVETGKLAYVSLQSMRDILHYNTDGVFW